MKRISCRRIAGLAGLALAAGFLVAQPNIIQAQAQGTARGGGANLLGKPKTVEPAHSGHHHAKASCAMCKNSAVTVEDIEARGGGAKALLARGTPTKTVVKHLCEGCKDTWTVTGHGKQKKAVAIHTCAMKGENGGSCCAAKS